MESNPILIISDLEGFSINSSINSSTKYSKLILNGDIIDSTFTSSITDRLDNKSFNIRNIKEAESNESIINILGNRDINKIKCKFLCKLNGNNMLIENFNNGNINLNIQTYIDIKTKLNTDVWKISNMNAWYTFWNNNVGKGKNWTTVPDYSSTPFLSRFYEIFGADNGLTNGGTMSAQNLLFTIPYEYKILNSITEEENVSPIVKQDYYAFIVLAIFKSMLINNNSPHTISYTNNSSDFKGLLANLYRKSFVCTNLDFNNKLYLISHGGITNNLINNFVSSEDNIIVKILDTLKKNEELNNILTNSVVFWENMKGGYYNSNTEISTVSKEKLLECLNFVNNKFKNAIQNILDGPDELPNGKPDINTLFLLIMSAPFNCANFLSKIDTTKYNFNCGNISNTELISPILPGYRNIRKEFFLIKDIEIIQIFGHQPVGYCGTIDLFTNPERPNLNSYAIVTDFSNTFANSLINRGNSKSYVLINTDGSSRVLSTIEYSFPADKVVNCCENGNLLVNFNSFSQENFNKLYFNDYNKDQIEGEIQLNSNLNDLELVDLLKKSSLTNSSDNYINFHGYYIDNGVQRVVFTLNQNDSKQMFIKIFFNLTKDNYIKFMSNTISTNINGGSYPDYKSKYLKYKNKYLELKALYKK